MMGSLPTCWYCPECDQVGGGHKLECYSKTPPSPIKVPMILPGTPLSVILDTLGIKYRAVTGSAPMFGVQVHDDPEDADNYSWIGGPVLVVDNDG